MAQKYPIYPIGAFREMDTGRLQNTDSAIE